MRKFIVGIIATVVAAVAVLALATSASASTHDDGLAKTVTSVD